MRLKYVVFPAPFGPTIAVSSPAWKAQVTASTATWPPKRTVSPSVSRSVCVMGHALRGVEAGTAAAPAPRTSVADRDIHVLDAKLADKDGDAVVPALLDFGPEVIHGL